jgi:hypothetical protein
MLKRNNRQLDQQGFASIVIALVLILVLALLTVGFAELARREQQNTLDKQLATQAYYAAESGVNDITHLIKLALANSTDPTYHPSLSELTAVDPNQCLESQSVPNLPSNIVDPTYDVKYTCVLLNLHPPSLLKSPISANSAWNLSFSTSESSGASPAPLKKLTVNWQSVGGKGPRATGGFTSAGSWNAMAALQVNITPLAQLDRPSLLNNTYTAYLYPSSGGGGTTIYTPSGSLAQAPVVNASGCSVGSHTCSVTIDGINVLGSVANESYLVTILDYYDTSTISITNAVDANGAALNFTDGQAQIDATGKDKDVLKRIQVHIPINGAANTLPSYAIQAQDICKRLDTQPGGTTYESAGSGATPTSLPDGNDPCSFDGNIPQN